MIEQDEFHDWWSNGSFWVQLSYTSTERLRVAFLRVLSKMPARDRGKFLQESPIVICSEHKGMAVNFWRPVHPKLGMIEIGIIVLRHDIVRSRGLIDTVAHEAAHIILGHHKTKACAVHLLSKEEKSADDRSASWGFKRCYSRNMLSKLKAKDKQTEEILKKIINERMAATATNG